MYFFQWLKWLPAAVFLVVIAVVSVRIRRKRRRPERIVSEKGPKLFDLLTIEMVAYAREQGVVCHEEIEAHSGGPSLVRTTTDRFGKRRYVEHQYLHNGQIRLTICRYDGGSRIPSTSAIQERSASSYDRDAFNNAIRDICERGSKISFCEGSGLNYQMRVPAKTVELRV